MGVFLSFVFLRNVNKFEIAVHLPSMDDIKIIIYVLIGAFWVISALVKKNKKKPPLRKVTEVAPERKLSPAAIKNIQEAQKELLESIRGMGDSYKRMLGNAETSFTEDEEMARAGSLEAFSSDTLPRVKKQEEDVAYQTKDISLRTPVQEEFRNAIIWQAILNRPQF
jgi:hypothetical protein